jgi:hypothetical protein
MSNDGELGDYAIDPDEIRRQAQDAMAGRPGSDDADLIADAMRELEKRILARVPDAKEQDQVRDLLSDLLDLAPGAAQNPWAARETARRVLAGPGRTLDDEEINTYAVFFKHHQAADSSDITSYPCVALGGDEDNDGAVQVYVYAQGGGLVVSLHFDSAGPAEDGSGPWAYYGTHHAIPATVIGGNGEPVYVAAEGVPDLSDALTAEAHDILARLREVLEPDDIDHEELRGTAEILGGVLRAFLEITGRPNTPGNLPEGGFRAEGGSQ